MKLLKLLLVSIFLLTLSFIAKGQDPSDFKVHKLTANDTIRYEGRSGKNGIGTLFADSTWQWTAYDPDSLAFVINYNTGKIYLRQNTFKIGIGTSNPIYEIDNPSGTISTKYFRLTNGSVNGYILYTDGLGNTYWGAPPAGGGGGSGDSIWKRTAPNGPVTLKHLSDVVEIGTGNPGSNRLWVSGDIAIPASGEINSGTTPIISTKSSPSSLYLGQDAGAGSSSQSNDIAIGQSSQTGGMGQGNITIGSFTGINMNGDTNIVIGYRAGRYAPTGLTNTIIIGTRAGTDIPLPINNSIIIGSGGHTLLYGNTAAGNHTLNVRGNLTVNEGTNAWKLATSKGINGQVLISNGAGLSTWTTIPGLSSNIVYAKYTTRVSGKVSSWIIGDTVFSDTTQTRVYSLGNIAITGTYPNYYVGINDTNYYKTTPDTAYGPHYFLNNVAHNTLDNPTLTITGHSGNGGVLYVKNTCEGTIDDGSASGIVIDIPASSDNNIHYQRGIFINNYSSKMVEAIYNYSAVAGAAYNGYSGFIGNNLGRVMWLRGGSIGLEIQSNTESQTALKITNGRVDFSYVGQTLIFDSVYVKNSITGKLATAHKSLLGFALMDSLYWGRSSTLGAVYLKNDTDYIGFRNSLFDPLPGKYDFNTYNTKISSSVVATDTIAGKQLFIAGRRAMYEGSGHQLRIGVVKYTGMPTDVDSSAFNSVVIATGRRLDNSETRLLMKSQSATFNQDTVVIQNILQVNKELRLMYPKLFFDNDPSQDTILLSYNGNSNYITRQQLYDVMPQTIYTAGDDIRISNNIVSLKDTIAVTDARITNSIIFSTPTNPVVRARQLYWNNADQTLDLNVDTIGGTTLSVGQEMYIRVVNKTGSQINDGQVVYINGAQGNRPTATQALSNSYTTSNVIGVATQNIANNAEGFVTVFGLVHNYNTSGFSTGDLLYLSPSTPGLLVNTPPSTPNMMVQVAIALNSTANGLIFVNPRRPLSADSAMSGGSNLYVPTELAIKNYLVNRYAPKNHTQGWTTITSQPNIVSSVDGVTNDEADIDLVQGGIVTIIPNDATNTITISATEVDGSITNEIQNLSYTPSTRILAIDGTGSTDVTLPLFSTTSTDPGLVSGGSGISAKFLRGDNTWQTVLTSESFLGTVTNIATGYGLSGGPITSTGTIIVDSANVNGPASKPWVTTYTANRYVPLSRTISTTAPLAGGGALSGNLTLSIPAGGPSQNGYFPSTYANKIDNDSIKWGMIERLGFENNTSTSIGFNNSTRVFTLTDAGSSWRYFQNGRFFTISGNKTVTIANTIGMHYIFIDANTTNGNLTESTTAWTLEDGKVPVAMILWDGTKSTSFNYFQADERHTARMDYRDQWYNHKTEGTHWIGGGILSGYTLNTAGNAGNTFGYDSPTLVDQDIQHTVDAFVDPNGTAGAYMKLYRTGPSTWTWDTSAMPYAFNPAGPYTYMQWDNGGTMTTGINNRWYNTYVCYSNQKKIGSTYQMFIISGQGEFSSAAAAYAESPNTMTFTGIPEDELIFAYQITWNTAGVNNTVRGRTRIDRVQRLGSSLNATTVGVPTPVVVTASPITGDGSSGSPISIPAATNSVNGYLTSSDWTLFNGKLGSEVDGSITNEIQNISYNSSTRAVGIDLGGTGFTFPLVTGLYAGLVPAYGLSPTGLRFISDNNGWVNLDTALNIRTYIIDAVGDLIVGNGNNTYKRLAKGSANQILRTNAGGTDIEWYTPSSGGTVTSVAAGYGLNFSTITTTGSVILDSATVYGYTRGYLPTRYAAISHTQAWSTITSQPNIVSSIEGVTNDEGNIDLVGAGILSITSDDGANTITLTATEADGSVTNELNTSMSWVDGTNTIGVVDANGTKSVVITGFLESEVDGSVTNEAQTLSAGGTTAPTIGLSTAGGAGGGTITFNGAGITTLGQNAGTITITSTEVDGSTTNELQPILKDGVTIGTRLKIDMQDSLGMVVTSTDDVTNNRVKVSMRVDTSGNYVASKPWVTTYTANRYSVLTHNHTGVYQPAGTYVNSVSGTSPISSSGGTTPAISIANAVADGATKGAASFTANDFDATSGNISIDYTNGQKATTSVPGFLTAADWNTFKGADSANNVRKYVFDAAGDLLVGTANNAYAKLTKGSALQYLRVNAGGTALEYAAFPTIPTTSDYIANQTASPQTAGFNINGSGTFGGNINLVTTTSTAGIINQNSTTLLHTFTKVGSPHGNIFLGQGSGNFTLGGTSAQGIYNTGIGDSTLYRITTCVANTAVGFDALKFHKIGNSNTAVGMIALYRDSTGVSNSAFGYAALTLNKEGRYNTAFGNGSLGNSLSTGNTGVGNKSGYNITTGNHNTFIGDSTGVNALQKVDAANSTAIGYNAYTTADNQIVIGDVNVTELKSAAKFTTPASTTTYAGLILPHGTAPTSPVNGDLWTTTAGLYVRINGSTVGPLGTGGGGMVYPGAGIANSTGAAWGTSYSTSGTGTVVALTASPTFTGTPVLPTPFTIGAVSMTATGTQLNYLNAATGTTGTASTNLVFSASPTFTGTVTIPTPFTLGATSMTTTAVKLNYLTSATGTTGTTNTNIVFSASPTLSGTTTLADAKATGKVGIGIGSATLSHPLQVYDNGYNSSTGTAEVRSFSTASDWTGQVYVTYGKSHSNTIGTLSTTTTGEVIGGFGFFGVSTDNSSQPLAEVSCVQNNTAQPIANGWSGGKMQFRVGSKTNGVTGFILDSTGIIVDKNLTVNGAINFGIDAQATDAYVITTSPPTTSYVVGQVIYFKANTRNTGAATINVNGLGVKTIVKRVNTTLADSDIEQYMFCHLIYDGTNFVLLNPITN